MKTAIIYHSQTGFTKRYAEWIAEAAGADCFDLAEAKMFTKQLFLEAGRVRAVSASLAG